MEDVELEARKWGHVSIIDERRFMPEVDFTFTGELRDYQVGAIDDVLGSDFGTLEAGTGSGKTVMALNIIAERRQPALVIVHTKELLHQWVSRAQQFLDLEPGEIGIFGDGKKVLGDRLTIGMVQTLRGCVDQVADHVGHVIIDEVHHVPASTFKDVLSAVDCRYQLGLTATPYRRDGLGKLIEWFVGPVVHRVARGRLMDTGAILRPQIITRRTDFWGRTDPAAQWGRFVTELLGDEARNRLICKDIEGETRRGSTCLVLSDRVDHCERLRSMLENRSIEARLLTGKVPRRTRQEVVELIEAGALPCIIGTSSLCGEGLDLPTLDALFLSSPIKFTGKVIQLIGRVLRPAPGKSAPRIYDYVDAHGVLGHQAAARQRAYARMGAAGDV